MLDAANFTVGADRERRGRYSGCCPESAVSCPYKKSCRA